MAARRGLTRRLELGFVAAAARHRDLPPTRREVALVGRSNVGKSSLINALAGRTGLARVSGTPGHTRVLTLFALPSGGGVVDLPGYGFARAPRDEQARWQGMIEGYLLERDELDLVLVLVDAAIGPSATDAQMLGWLGANGLPFAVVAMKADTVRPSATARRKRELAIACGLEPGDLSWVSATKGTGIDQLRRHLASLLAP